MFSVTIASSQGEKEKHRLSRGFAQAYLKGVSVNWKAAGCEQLTLTVMNAAGDSVIQMNPINLIKWTVRFPYRLCIRMKSWENSF